ncbi:MAG: hypothetical protein AAGM67_20485, partial [Bacteroidota bacterium]
MKKITLGIVLLGLCLSMQAQDDQYRNTLSLDFYGPIVSAGLLLLPNRPAPNSFAFIPSLEYRRAIGERMAWRLDFDYHPLRNTEQGV